MRVAHFFRGGARALALAHVRGLRQGGAAEARDLARANARITRLREGACGGTGRKSNHN